MHQHVVPDLPAAACRLVQLDFQELVRTANVDDLPILTSRVGHIELGCPSVTSDKRPEIDGPRREHDVAADVASDLQLNLREGRLVNRDRDRRSSLAEKRLGVESHADFTRFARCQEDPFRSKASYIHNANARRQHARSPCTGS